MARKTNTCPYCDQSHSTKARLVKHIEKCHFDEDEIFLECKNCNKEISYVDKHGECCSIECFRAEKYKKESIIAKPSNKYSYINIDKHKDIVFKDGKYNCPHCTSNYTQYNKLKMHLYDKHTERTGVCYGCGGENKTTGPYCSRACSNKRTFSMETNLKKSRIEFEKSGMRPKETLEDFTKRRLERKFGDEYGFDFVTSYKNKQTKIKLECKKHGIFEIFPRNIERSGGCPKCYGEFVEKKKIGVDVFLKRARDVHNNKYTYVKLQNEYLVNKTEKVSILCPKHGEFKQQNGIHLNGCGCPKCGKKIMTQDEAIESFIKVHGEGKYDYSMVNFEHTKVKVKIICNKCKKIFKQLPNNHLQGQNCPYCAVSGYKMDRPGRLYYLRVEVDGKTFYKIGITNYTVKKRFGSDMKYITSLREIVFQDGAVAYGLEQKILKKYEDFKYEDEYILKSGNTELFTKDIFGLDKVGCLEM